MTRRLVFLAVGVALAAGGCRREAAVASAPQSSAPAPAAAQGSVVADVDGVALTLAELDQRAALAHLRQQEYEARRKAADDWVAERLLAKEAAARGLTPAELLQKEVADRVPAPTPAEIQAVFDQHKSELGGRDRQDVAAQIQEMLRGQSTAQRRLAFQQELRQKTQVHITLAPPRFEVPVPAGAPALGSAQAPVTILEFLDYQCPYCRRAQKTVDQILARYSGKVRFVHRDFPIQGHPRAFPAAQAARCAGEQGKFWGYHRDLLLKPSDFSEADLKKRAGALGLDVLSFSSCLGSGRHDDEIRASVDVGTRLGVDSTPTFFINGRMVVGAQPLPQFQEVIAGELAGQQ